MNALMNLCLKVLMKVNAIVHGKDVRHNDCKCLQSHSSRATTHCDAFAFAIVIKIAGMFMRSVKKSRFQILCHVTLCYFTLGSVRVSHFALCLPTLCFFAFCHVTFYHSVLYHFALVRSLCITSPRVHSASVTLLCVAPPSVFFPFDLKLCVINCHQSPHLLQLDRPS